MANLGNWFGGMFGGGDTNYQEAQAANAISREIGRYLSYNGYMDSDGFYTSHHVTGGFPFDLSSFSPMAVRRILSRVRNSSRSVKVSISYNPINRTINFTIKGR